MHNIRKLADEVSELRRENPREYRAIPHAINKILKNHNVPDKDKSELRSRVASELGKRGSARKAKKKRSQKEKRERMHREAEELAFQNREHEIPDLF